MDTFVFIMEIIGTIAFASAGAMVAVEKEMDLLGVCVLGMTTAVGGGMIRDLILGVNPPVMFQNPVYALVAIAFSMLVFIVAYYNHKLQESKLYVAYDRLMLVCDALGLAIFTVVGVNAAWNMEYETTTFLQIFVGVLTGVGGGVLRDVMAGNTPYIFVKHIYASASIIGAVVTIVLMNFFGELTGMIAGAVIVFVIRIFAAYFKWNLPRIRKD
ncbi:MAG: trimeric intracellular cation channel family protein [Lachnospiraceae bacterium]|nr:trimeric intracellular cation channel family protein [Lachnospiraceae bacterium]